MEWRGEGPALLLMIARKQQKQTQIFRIMRSSPGQDKNPKRTFTYIYILFSQIKKNVALPTFANMSSDNLPTEAAENKMHPHDTTGAKPHLYGAYYKAFVLPERENKELRDQPCCSGVEKKFGDLCDDIKPNI